MRRSSVLVLGLAACNRDTVVPCTATVLPEVHTIVNVAWETEAAGTSWVEYGLDAELGSETPRIEGDELQHTTDLLGLPPLTDVFYKAVTDAGAGKRSICEGSVSTENLPPGMPEIEITIDEPERQSSEAYLIGTFWQNSVNTQFIVDRKGQWSWYLNGDPGRGTIEILFAPDGSGILRNEFDAAFVEDVAQVYTTDVAGRPVGAVRTELAHHVFTALPDGTIAYLKVDMRPWFDEELGEEVTVAGDTLVELAPDGSLTEVWSTWDHLPVVKSPSWDTPFWADAKSWTHANSLHYNPATDTYLMNLAYIVTTVEIRRSDGSVARQFGGDGGYTLTAGSTAYEAAHDVGLTPDGTLIMFATDDARSASGALEFQIDDEARTLDEIWSHGFDEQRESKILGQATRLENGNTMVNYAALGEVREVAPDGRVVWQASGQLGPFLGNVHLFSDPYTGE